MENEIEGTRVGEESGKSEKEKDDRESTSNDNAYEGAGAEREI